VVTVAGVSAGVYIFDPFIRSFCGKQRDFLQKEMEQKSGQVSKLTTQEKVRLEQQIKRLDAVARAESLWDHWRQQLEKRERR